MEPSIRAFFVGLFLDNAYNLYGSKTWLKAANVMQLLRPLLLDIIPTVQQTAALALGRLANYSDDMAEAVVKSDILPQLIYSLGESWTLRADNSIVLSNLFSVK